MRRKVLVKYLFSYSCVLFREGKSHSIWVNRNNNKTAIPRHNEISNILAKEICNQLGIDKII